MSVLEIEPDASGSLNETPLPRLLLALHRQRFEGELKLTGQRAEKRFVFAAGSPVLAESNLASETLGMQLVEQGLITRAQYDQVCAEMKNRGSREGVALLALKLITPKDLFQALKDQVRRRLIEAFGWPDGEYALDPEAEVGEDVQPFRVDPLDLVQAGLEAHWGVDRMLGDLTPRLAAYPKGTKRLPKIAPRLTEDPAEQAALVGIDGTKTLTDIVGAAMSSTRALARIWVLDAIGAVAYLDEAFDPTSGAVGGDLEFDIEVQEMAASEAAPETDSTPGGAPHAAKRRRKSSDGIDEKAEAVRQEILDRHDLLGESKDDVTHYRILDIDPAANAGVIKKAYFKAAKRYHPDALGRIGLEDVKDMAADVFARIAEAFEVLGDERKRQSYDEVLAGGGAEEIDTAALAQAETLFRKGEILIKMGDFKGAEPFLRSCIELWPEEAAYQAAFGWTLFKKAPSEPEEARRHLEHALQLDPEDVDALQWLDMVKRALA